LNLAEAIEATPQPSEAMQPRNGSLHKPTELAQAAAMLPLPLAQHRRDPQPAQQHPQRLRIVASVALQAVRPLAPRPRLAADRRLVHEHVQDLRDLIDVGGGHGRVQGNAVRVGQDVVLAAGLAAVGGVRAGVFAPFRGLAKGGVDERPRPVDRVGTVQFGQEQGVQALPDARLIPAPQVVAAGLAAAAAEVGGQVVPGDAGLEDEQDAGQDLAVVQGFAAGEAGAARRRRWQQGLHTLPEFVRNQGLHGVPSSVGKTTPQLTKVQPACRLTHFFRTL
jgi:hypothetical protein